MTTPTHTRAREQGSPPRGRSRVAGGVAAAPESCLSHGDFEKDSRAQRQQNPTVRAAYGPGSAPHKYGRYLLVGQPESLIICERMESAPFLMRGQ